MSFDLSGGSLGYRISFERSDMEDVVRVMCDAMMIHSLNIATPALYRKYNSPTYLQLSGAQLKVIWLPRRFYYGEEWNSANCHDGIELIVL